MSKKSIPALILVLLVAAFWYIVFSILVGCNPIQKAERRVLADIESVKRVRATTDPLFPCTDTTSREVKKGGVDSLQLGDLFRNAPWVTGPSTSNPWAGTLPDNRLEPVDGGMMRGTVSLYYDSTCYSQGYKDGVKFVLSQKVAVSRPDTVRETKTPTRDLNACKDSVNSLRLRLSNEQGQNTALRLHLEQKTDDHATTKTYLYLVIGIAALLLVLIVLLILNKVKIPKL